MSNREKTVKLKSRKKSLSSDETQGRKYVIHYEQNEIFPDKE